MSKGGGTGGPFESSDFNYSNLVYKLVKISKEESKNSNGKELISYDYIKRIESERLFCMIYESYQRFKTQITGDLELNGGMKFEEFLEAAKKGKLFSDDNLIYWIINIENTKGMQLLKDFRNDYSHYTNTDLSILRQWRTRLIDDSEAESIKKSTDHLLNEAALNILNTVIDYLSRPEARPLQRKRVRSTDQVVDPTLNKTNRTNMKVVKRSGSELSMMSKKQRKKLRQMLLRPASPSNAFVIGKLPAAEEGEGSVVPDLSSKLVSSGVLLPVSCPLSIPIEISLPISSASSSSSNLSETASKISDTNSEISIVASDTANTSIDQKPTIQHSHHKALFEAYHRNSQIIGQLRKNGAMTPQKMAEIRRLRLENQRMVKEKGSGIMCSAEKQQKKQQKQKK